MLWIGATKAVLLATSLASGSALVERNGHVIFQQGDLHKTYNIGSNTKGFTAAAIMKLVKSGKLSLDDSLHIRQLLTHTWTGKYEYSNEGYERLARIVARVSGKSYSDYLRVEIFRPAGLRETTARHANGATGIESSVHDLMKWAHLQHTEEMRPQVFVRNENGRQISYGYGWGIEEEEGRIVEIRHYGWDGNYSSAIRIFPRKDLIVVAASDAGAMDHITWSSRRARQLADSLRSSDR